MNNETAKNEKIAYEYAMDLRKKWGLGNMPITDIKSLVNTKDFLLLLFPTPLEVDGLTLEKYDAGKLVNCIYANSNRPLGRVYFTIAHELYHIYYEKSDKDKVTSIDYKDPVERRAEAFAGHFLIPQKHLVEVLKAAGISNNQVIDMKRLFDIQKIYGVSFQALLFAILKLKHTKFQYVVPKNIQMFTKYFKKEHWSEITQLTESYDLENKLNSITKEYYIPEDIEEKIRSNFQNNRIDEETATTLLGFFTRKL